MFDDERDRVCVKPPPKTMLAELEGYEWARDTVGESGSAVYRLYGKAGAPDLFLKYGKDAIADDISDEMARLLWLGRHIPVPALTQFVRTRDQAWLLMTALRGKTAHQVLASSPNACNAIVDALAAFLRRLHAIPVSECPFRGDHVLRLHHARMRIDAGLVDVDGFDAGREGWTAEQVWLEIERVLPLTFDSVVTHGDFSLDNILVNEGEIVGCIDVGRVGIADPYRDLAVIWNSIGDVNPLLQERLFLQYGIHDPDQRRLKFHLMLDELS